VVDTIFKASNKFFTDVVGIKVEDGKKLLSNNLLINSIEISKGQKKDTIYFGMQKSTLKKIAFAYLHEENLEQNELIDFFNEVANMIAGSAKVMIEDDSSDIQYHLSTPKFREELTCLLDVKCDEKKIYKTFGRCFFVGLKNRG
jgi:CheY-specific phosphatase CheX